MKLKQISRHKITQADLIQEMYDDLNGIYSTETITAFIKSFEDVILSYLKMATEDTQILIKPFFGLQLSSKVISEHTSTLNDKKYTRSVRIKANAKFTRYFNRTRLNDL